MFKRLKVQRLVKKINKALNIKLNKDQIDFIWYNKPISNGKRGSGKVIAWMIKVIITHDVYIRISDVRPDGISRRFFQFYSEWFISIYNKLKSAGLAKCVIRELELCAIKEMKIHG